MLLMRKNSHHKARENRIITLFKAIKSRLWRFSSVTVVALPALIFLVGFTAASYAQSKRANPFQPETQTLHVFPSYAETDSWQNLTSLFSQDLKEAALYQKFDANNSAYINVEDLEPAVRRVSIYDLVTEEDVATTNAQSENGSGELDGVENTTNLQTSSSSDQSSTQSTASSSTETVIEASESDVTSGTASSTDPALEEVLTTPDSSPSDLPEPTDTPVDNQPDEPAASSTARVPVVGSLFLKVAESLRFVVGIFSSSTASTTEAETVIATATPNEVVVEQASSTENTETEPDLPQILPIEAASPPSEFETGESASSTATSSETEILSLDSTSSTPDSASSTSATSSAQEGVATSSQQTLSLTLGDFGVPELASGEFIDNLQLRISLAGAYDASSSTPGFIDVSYQFGDFAGNAGTVLLDGEVSNAINGGYYLVPLPSVTDPAVLSDLKVTLAFTGEVTRLKDLYLDAAWLEVGTIVYDVDRLKNRHAPGQLTHLKQAEHMQFLGNQLDFERDDVPLFSFRYNSQRNVAVQAVRNILGRELVRVEEVRFMHGGKTSIPIDAEVTVTKEGLINVVMPEAERSKLKPGQYTVELEMSEGSVTFVDSFDFQWGILSINTNQTEYGREDVVEVSLGALTPNGNTLCNANLDLYVISPKGYISKVPVTPSGQCNGNNVIDVPDYSAEFPVDEHGEYELYLERLNDEGEVIGHTSSFFTVVMRQELALERVGPSRIYPPASYPMELTIHGRETGFSGTLIERLPRGFDVFNTDATINRYADFTELVWDVAVLASTSKTFSYEFDAPDLSPFLYEVGPASLTETSNRRIASAASLRAGGSTSTASSTQAVSTEEVNQDFTESRQWQIASDATGNIIVFYDGTGGMPSSDWTCLSCGSGTFYQRFVMGSSTYNSTGGNATHTHTGTGSVLASAAASTESNGGTAISNVSHTHTYSPTIGSASNTPAYSQIRVIQYTAAAGEPPSLPTGVVGVFDVASSSLPSGWLRYDALDARYPYSEDVIGTTGGSNTHNHTITGTTGAAAGGAEKALGGGTQTPGASVGHTHTVSSTTATDNIEPPHIEVLFARITATGSIPDNIITMWTEDVPGSWTDVSSDPASDFSNRFIKGASTYGTTGGTETHNHSDVTGIVSSVPSATQSARSGGAGADDAHTHSVSVTSFSTTNNLPPYITAVFGKRLGTDPVYDQISYRWYTNLDDQTPTDPWPSGATNLVENEPVTATSTPVKVNDVIRLRMNTEVTNATATAGTRYKLQYGAGDVCSAVTWSDVGDSASTTVWRGYDNASVADHSTLSSTTLASTTVAETYEESGVATSTPTDIGVDDVAEWDFVLEQNGALAGTNYCFRMVEEDGTAFSSYSRYPQLYTNEAPQAPTLTAPFDNAKIASTTQLFDFVTTDSEGETIHYEIQVDDDYSFGSPIVDRDSISNSTQFENQVLPSDKAPFNQGQAMQFTPSVTFSDGTTYYWRVRAQDPSGSNSWGDWSTIQSFTVDTSLTVSAWFQTTEEQFDTNTLVGLETPASDHVDLITGSTTGTMTGTAIDFDDKTLGSAWGRFYFTEVDPSTVIEYQIEYLTDAATWSLIPDADLPGNSTGLTATTTLLDLDTTTYNVIRVIANFTGSGGSPQVNDWTIEWGFRVETPTLTKLFPNEKTGTTTPIFEFSTTDPQSDDLTYQISWSTDNTFVTGSTTRTSDADTGFVNADDGGNTDPFRSGDTIQFTIQSGDALTNGTTYWWRARAKDTTGDNAYSLWTDPRSFTVDTTVVASTWFQTTEEQFDTDILSGTVALADDTVAVATTATEALIVYGEGTGNTPRYREWDGSVWGSEGSLNDIGAPLRWVRVAAGTTREEYVAVTIGTDNDVNAQVFATGEWTDLQEMTAGLSTLDARGIDVTYETLSGDAMVAYCDGDALPSYRIWDGSTWSTESTITVSETTDCEWIELASDPVSDEIIILTRGTDGSPYEAQVWNGSAWGNALTLGNITEAAHEGMSVEYEESGGQAVVVTSDGNPGRFEWNSWNGTTWGAPATQGIGNDFEWGQLVRDIGSDEMLLCYQDEDQDVGVVRWTGSAWAGQTELDTDGNAKNDPAFACVFENTSSRDNYIMTVLSDTVQVEYSFWNNTTWSANATVNSLTDSATMQLIRTGTDLILGTFFDDVNDTLNFTSWDGSSWSTTQALEDDASVDTSPYGQPYYMAPRNSGKEGTTIVSPGINFTEGLGPYWEEMSWVDTTPGSSEILYAMQYYDGDSWEFIPNSDLPGNESGTTTSPIDLSGLSVSTYNLIRPYAALSCDGSSNCPTISDWTVEWAEGITVSGTLEDYTETTPINSGTVAVAVNGVLQVGKTGTVSGGSWSIPNVTTFAGDVITVFVDGAADAAEAVGVTYYDGVGDITGMQLYERHLTLGSDVATSTPLTNALITQYNAGNDEDVFIDSSAGSLAVCADVDCSDAELFINASTTLSAGGDIATHDIEVQGTLTATSTVYVSGSWENTGTTTLDSSTVIFEATSTSETITTTGATVATFNNLTFGTTTGSATWTPATNLDIDGDLSVSRGTLSRSGIELTVVGDLTTGSVGVWNGLGTTTFDGSGISVWTDQNATQQNIGSVVIDGTTKTVQLGSDVLAESITIGADDTFDASASNYAVTVNDDWTNTGVFAPRSGEVIFAATDSGNLITSGGDAFYDLTFNGVGGDWSFTESTLLVNNDFTVATGTVTMPSATTTIAGSFDTVSGTFAHNNAVISFTSSGAETISASTTDFLNAFYDLHFDGGGSWSFLDQNATSSNDVRVEQGTVTFPTGTFTIGGSILDQGGSWVGNGGTVKLISSLSESITTGGSSFSNLLIDGSGTFTFTDASADIDGDLTLAQGTLLLPSASLTIGGSYDNNSTVTAGTGGVTFDSVDTGETIAFGGSSLYDVTFNGSGGGWTITENATATNAFTLTDGNDFTVNAAVTLSVGATFTNSIGGASTTWAGSTLSLEAGAYSINTKTDNGDTYGNLRIGTTADVSVWNSSATSVNVLSGGSLYSQDHAATDGELYIYGAYERTSGTEYWNYATDFDGTDLSGGSERQAQVFFAGGATASITASAIEVIGTSTASSTIQNQGSGTYTVTVSSGTTTAQYYDFADLGGAGLSLLSGTVVPTLRDGSYTVAEAAGSALTISSTTIDANPAKQIFNVQFATTTAIAATNVTQNDGTPTSYWWFRSGYGNLYGEAFDADTGDPGSVRFDDSALVVTISGTVYADDGVTPLVTSTCGTGAPVTVVIEGGSTYTGACNGADGTYSIAGVTIIGDPSVTIYLDNADNGEEAAVVTKTVTADITDLDLYGNRVITRHEDTDPLTIANLAAFDSSDDADLNFTAATGTTDVLAVEAGTELHVWATTTFTPGGPVTLHANATGDTFDGTLHLGADATYNAGATTTVGGSVDLEAGATYVPGTTALVMNATTTGKTIDTASDEVITLYELQFTGVGGGWNINGNASTTADIYVATGTVTGTGDITVDNGSFYGDGLVSLGGGYVVIEDTNTLGGVQGWTFNDLTLGTGATVGTTTPGSTATTTVGGVLTIGTAHFLDAGSSTWNLSGTGAVFVENGTFLEDTSTVVYSGAGATDILSTEYYNLTLSAAASSPTYTATGLGIQVFNDLVIGSSGTTTVTFDTSDPALNVDGDMTIGTLGTFIASDSNSFTLAGSYDNNGTFTGSGGTLTFDGSGVHTIAAGASDFSSVIINGTGDFTVTENATATAAWTLTSANDFTLQSDTTLAVGGTFTNSIGGVDTIWTDSTLRLYGGGNYEINASSVTDTYGTLEVAANTQIRMWNSDAATTTVDTSGSLYSMDHANTDGDLYIFGSYQNSATTDYWSYAVDFDGTDLSGGSERKVDVFVEASGSVLYTGASELSVFGVSTASTSIQNQSSGTYALTIGGSASTTLNYYEITDIDTNGLTFTGTPSVTDISFGYVTVANNADSGITVGGTAINANPALTFTQNGFATTSGVTTGTNVTATGTSVSSWRFTNHYGDIDGEASDSDPDGDPGYIVWDDSAANITISGTVYQDDTTSLPTMCPGGAIRVRVAGLTNYDTTCDGSGNYSVTNVTYSPGDSIIAYINGEATVGATVTADPVSNISNMDIYENHVIVRHENTSPLTISDMAVWDSSDDVDIPFTAVNSSPDTLTLPADRKLIVWTGKEFAPGGDVTLTNGGSQAYGGTLEIYDNGQFTAASGEDHSIGGSLISGTNAVFEAATASTTFTTSGSGRTIDINDGNFYNVAFTGSGSWAITDSVYDVNNHLQTAGTLTLPTGTTTVSGYFNTTGGAFVNNGSPMVFDGSGSGQTVAFAGSDTAGLTFTGSGSWSMTDTNATATDSVTVEAGTVTLPSGEFRVEGSFENTGGAVTHNTALLTLATTGAATLLASSSDLYAVTFADGGTFTMLDGSATLLDTLIIESGSVTVASGTLSIGGSFDASGGTFDNATGTILFNSSDTGETIDPGASDFYNVSFSGPSGGWTIVADATTTNNFTLSAATDFTLQSGATLAVEGVFTNSVGGSATEWSGSSLRLTSATEYAINNKANTGDAYENLYIGPSTDISSWHSGATTTVVDSSASYYSQDNAGVDGDLYIYGDYHIGTTTEYWSYATDFDGTDLTGGSERSVTVAHQNGATTTVDGGTLNIIGVSTNETLITNQGSGTYSFAVTDGTFNAQYYQYRNLDASGLNLSGTPTITSLDYGDFELAVAGGNLITLSSTTLNANASLVLTGNRFATTTAITGDNVDLSGTTAAAWTFTGHTGNLAGEDYDNDGGTACGQVRWDDSACLLTQQTGYRWRNDDGGLGVPADEWFDTDWNARKSVRVDNNDNTTYTDAVVELTVLYDADMQADFDDLRFTDESGTTTVSHFIASTTNSVMAEVWVKVPSLPANGTAHLYMYYDNAVATSTSSSTQTFIAADDFEDNDISEYSGDTSIFNVGTTFNYGGSYGLDNNGNEGTRATDGIARFDQSVGHGTDGQTIRYQQYVDTTPGSGDSDEVCTLFGVQSPVTVNQNYGVCLEQFGTSRITLGKNIVDTDSSGTQLASTTVSYSTGWYTVEIDWLPDDSITVNLIDPSGSVAATISATDSDYDTGGIGFTYWGNYGGWDNYTSRLYVATEPSIRFGAEVSDGGASWAAAQNSPATEFNINEVARVRFAVENTGLLVTDAYQLEYAEQGVAPSCEAVSSASYSAVLPDASCGGDPVCMATSTTVTNGAATADLLLDVDGDFVAGEFREDPSNTTGSLTVDQNEFTEVEFAIKLNNNVSDPSLCFRVTDSGSTLDTYLKVARLVTRFDPSFGGVSFNLGQDIALVGGTTTRVYATSTVTDLNGYADIVAGTSTMYTTGATAACAADPNNCYIASTNSECSFTDCAGNSCVLSCYADFIYHATATDSDGGQQWFAFLEAEDAAGGTDFNTSPGIDLLTLRYAENVSADIDYGALEVFGDTGAFNPTTTIRNTGNVPIDLNVDGINLSDGLTSEIPAEQQLFSTTTFTYSACVDCFAVPTTTPISLEVDLTKPTTTSFAIEDEIYWGISVPFGTKSNPHSGQNYFTPIDD